MSKGGGGQTVTQTNNPPAYLLPYLKTAVQGATDLYNKGPQPLFPGQNYAPINATEQQGLDATVAAGQSAGSNPYATDGLNTLDQIATSTPGQNPYIDQMLQMYGDKANQQVASQFNLGGRYGSGSNAAAAGTAITQATLPYLFQQYNTDMNNKMQAAGALPGLQNTALQGQLAGANAITGVGNVYGTQDQNAINQANQNFQWTHGGGEQSALDNYISEINNNPLSKDGTSTSHTSTSSGIGSTIGGIASGLGTLGGLGTGLTSFLGGGSSLAATLGGTSGFLGDIGSILGIFSDERLKENFVPMGEENGHKVYEFNYKHGSGRRYIGVKAQEVLEKNPEAITKGEFGFLSVDYGKIGVRHREAAGPSFTGAGKRRGAAPGTPSGVGVDPGAAACGMADCRGL